jgi:AraC-like DNA-binding protein
LAHFLAHERDRLRGGLEERSRSLSGDRTVPGSHVYDIADPALFRPALRGGEGELFVVGRGQFDAELVRIDLDRLWLQRGTETLSRIVHVANDPKRAPIFFLADAQQPAMQHRGIPLSAGEIAVYSLGAVNHHRTDAATRFATMSLTPSDLAAASEAIAGCPLEAPAQTRTVRPAAPLMARLMALHEKAARLAKEAPDLLVHPETVKALEQDLVRAMVACLTDSQSSRVKSTGGHARIIARFEDFLESRRYEPVYLAEICAAIRVSERTLRACCQEHLGMAPMHYLWLRRMHLAHRGLLCADPAAATVTAIATEYGFWELGRFSIEYRALFGETPSAALQRRRSER